jgi:hypothetical protein
MPSDGKSSHCLWQGELKKKTPLFNTFGPLVPFVVIEWKKFFREPSNEHSYLVCLQLAQQFLRRRLKCTR